MKMPDKIDNKMLAACGVNCLACYKHIAKKDACNGCKFQDETLPKRCRNCKIYKCSQEKNVSYCYECEGYPCPLIKRLDKSYRERYNVDLIANGIFTKENGVEEFMKQEKEKWTCRECDSIISQHNGTCECQIVK